MFFPFVSTRRRWFVPEVVQTSATDCGPASLKCLLDGFGVRASYGRLREACQTDVDGTSIDTLEDVASQLGLEALQTMIPRDHLLLDESAALPALVVVQQPGGQTHFVVVWRLHGRFVQVMDPASGRRWVDRREFLDEVYTHDLLVPPGAWRAWAGSPKFAAPLRRRIEQLGASRAVADGLIAEALADTDWQSIAALDAAVRMVASIVTSGALRRGRETERIVTRCFEEARHEPPDVCRVIPSNFWSARTAHPGPEGQPRLFVRGAVLIHVRGRQAEPAPGEPLEPTKPRITSPELAAALTEPPSRPGRELFHTLREDGLLAPTAIAAAVVLAAVGVLIEALLFRGVLELGQTIGTVPHRIGAWGALLAFIAAMTAIELPTIAGSLRLGRRIESRLRLKLLRKIPRLADRYLHSRLTSDMADRCHTLQRLRELPRLGFQFLRSFAALGLTTAGLIWLDSGSTGLALAAAVTAVLLPLIVQSPLAERDLRVRTHAAALSTFYLDAMLGLAPIRTHGAERAVRRNHESLLVEWMRSSHSLLRAQVTAEGLVTLVGIAIAASLLISYYLRQGDSGGMLLVAYWALSLPALGQEVAAAARHYPQHRNVTLRLLEPLGALEQADASADASQTSDAKDEASDEAASDTSDDGAASIQMRGVSVRAAGRAILNDIDLDIDAGRHVAILGASGAGKSSLVGLLLGWHRAAAGRVTVDDKLLTSKTLRRLRSRTAWVDPAVRLWNQSLLDNLLYGAPREDRPDIAEITALAELRSLLETLPEGLQTSLGQGGALVSGGEGQRVRLGRALMRRRAGLVILDEPFRGLDREVRHQLLRRAREWWRDATLLCITHDVAAAVTFEQVIVLDAGRVVEKGPPDQLLAQPESRMRKMLTDEETVQQLLRGEAGWRRWRVEQGRVREERIGVSPTGTARPEPTNVDEDEESA